MSEQFSEIKSDILAEARAGVSLTEKQNHTFDLDDLPQDVSFLTAYAEQFPEQVLRQLPTDIRFEDLDVRAAVVVKAVAIKRPSEIWERIRYEDLRYSPKTCRLMCEMAHSIPDKILEILPKKCADWDREHGAYQELLQALALVVPQEIFARIEPISDWSDVKSSAIGVLAALYQTIPDQVLEMFPVLEELLQPLELSSITYTRYERYFALFQVNPDQVLNQLPQSLPEIDEISTDSWFLLQLLAEHSPETVADLLSTQTFELDNIPTSYVNVLFSLVKSGFTDIGSLLPTGDWYSFFVNTDLLSFLSKYVEELSDSILQILPDITQFDSFSDEMWNLLSELARIKPTQLLAKFPNKLRPEDYAHSSVLCDIAKSGVSGILEKYDDECYELGSININVADVMEVVATTAPEAVVEKLHGSFSDWEQVSSSGTKYLEQLALDYSEQVFEFLPQEKMTAEQFSNFKSFTLLSQLARAIPNLMIPILPDRFEWKSLKYRGWNFLEILALSYPEIVLRLVKNSYNNDQVEYFQCRTLAILARFNPDEILKFMPKSISDLSMHSSKVPQSLYSVLIEIAESRPDEVKAILPQHINGSLSPYAYKFLLKLGLVSPHNTILTFSDFCSLDYHQLTNLIAANDTTYDMAEAETLASPRQKITPEELDAFSGTVSAPSVVTQIKFLPIESGSFQALRGGWIKGEVRKGGSDSFVYLQLATDPPKIVFRTRKVSQENLKTYTAAAKLLTEYVTSDTYQELQDTETTLHVRSDGFREVYAGMSVAAIDLSTLPPVIAESITKQIAYVRYKLVCHGIDHGHFHDHNFNVRFLLENPVTSRREVIFDVNMAICRSQQEQLELTPIVTLRDWDLATSSPANTNQ